MSDTEKKVTRNTIISEALVVACSPALAYLFAFTYEAGFAKVFKIPLSFIELNLTTVFVVASAVGIVLVILLLFINYLYAFVVTPFRQKKYLIPRICASFTMFIWFFAKFLFFGPLLWKQWIGSLLTLIFVVMFFFLIPLITQGSKRSYLEKLKAHGAGAPETLVSHISMHGGWRFVFYLYCLWLLVDLMGAAGQAKAMRQKEFFVPSASPDTVVLRIYRENLICAPFNKEGRTVQRSLIIHKLVESPPLTLRVEEVGPLSLKKP